VLSGGIISISSPRVVAVGVGVMRTEAEEGALSERRPPLLGDPKLIRGLRLKLLSKVNALSNLPRRYDTLESMSD
jgi:hypothetical protein